MTTRYDYNRQAWIEDDRYVRCGHPETMDCGCYGRLHEGEPAPSRETCVWCGLPIMGYVHNNIHAATGEYAPMCAACDALN